MDKCFEYKNEWDNCSNKIIIKYFSKDDSVEYYKKMVPCFRNYKKYIECMIK